MYMEIHQDTYLNVSQILFVNHIFKMIKEHTVNISSMNLNLVEELSNWGIRFIKFSFYKI